MKKWEDAFTKEVLYRGYCLFDQDQILEAVRCPNGYEVVVHDDAKDYRVAVEMDLGEIAAMHCGCTYASEGASCKHMAAALYALTQKVPNEFKDAWEYKNTELYSLIQSIEEDALKDFIYQLACKDKRFSNRLWLQFFKGESVEELRPLERSLNTICKKYLGLEQFIPYWDAGDFYKEVEGFFDRNLKILMDREHYESAFDFIAMVYDKLCQIEIDDSDGDIEFLAKECSEAWKEVLPHIENTAEERRIHRWFMDRIGVNTVNDLEDYVFEVFMDWNWSSGLLSESLKLVDWLILNAPPERLEYWLETYAVCRVNLMVMIGVPMEAVEAYQKRYWQFPGIRSAAILYKIENGQMEDALKLTLESMEMDKDIPEKIDEYQRILAWLYEKMDKPDELKKLMAEALVGEDFVQPDDFKKLRSLCGEEEWLELREAIFKNLDYEYNRRALLHEEALYDRLLEDIRHHGGLSDLDYYEETLKTGCPEGTLELYTFFVQDMVQKATNRRKYQKIAEYLRKMQGYPGGPERVQVLAEDWRLRYPKRRALIEELDAL